MFIHWSQEEREARTVSAIKHGGGHVRVWTSFGNNKPGSLVKITKKLIEAIIANKALRILKDTAIPSGQITLVLNSLFNKTL